MRTEKLSILQALEKVHEVSDKSKLHQDYFVTVKPEIELISDYFFTTEIQSIILANLICMSCTDEIRLRDFFRHLDIENLGQIKYSNEIKMLVNKNIIIQNKSRHYREEYSINKGILKYLSNEERIPKELISELVLEDNFQEFLKKVDDLSDAKDDDQIDYRCFCLELEKLIEENTKFPMVKYANDHLDLIDSFVFFDTMIDAIGHGDNDFNTDLQKTINDFTHRKSDTFNYLSDFLNGKTKLNTHNLVEKDNNQFGNRHRIQLSDKTLQMLEEHEGIKLLNLESKNEKLIYPDKIKAVELYYNPNEKRQLEPVLHSMSDAHFLNLQNRLKDNGLHTGVSVLLYGAPGTGKTETVYQLAKTYSRPVFKVEISETKSMWFGESQKLVKKIFTNYYEYKKREKVCPILLFNEADAVIGKRKSAGSSSVADTENAIQNILLEELENFDGILFATSNLVNNLDPAFERRFLFKIKFEKPSVENAAKIWQSKLPTLTSDQAIELAHRFSFSGGEMENIARKCIMEEVVLGNLLSFNKIVEFCQTEKWDNQTSTKKIGF